MSAKLVLKKISAYCRSTNIEPLRQEMLKFDDNLTKFNHYFYRTTVNEKSLNQAIKELLQSLDIPQYMWGRYLGQKIIIFNFLKELSALSDETKAKITPVIALIESSNQALNMKSLLNVAVLCFVLLHLAIPILLLSGVPLVLSIISSSLFFPMLSVIYTLGAAAYSLYQNTMYPEITRFEFFHSNFFLLAKASANITAYMILLGSFVNAVEFASKLFVISSFLNWIEKVISWAHVIWYQHKLSSKEAVGNNGLESKQEHIRLNAELSKIKYKMLIGLACTLTMMSVTAVIAFFPSGIMLSVLSLAIMMVLYGLKSWQVSRVCRSIDAKMIKDLEALEQAYCDEHGIQHTATQHPTTEAAANDAKPEISGLKTEKSAVKISPSTLGIFSIKASVPRNSGEKSVLEPSATKRASFF